MNPTPKIKAWNSLDEDVSINALDIADFMLIPTKESWDELTREVPEVDLMFPTMGQDPRGMYYNDHGKFYPIQCLRDQYDHALDLIEEFLKGDGT